MCGGWGGRVRVIMMVRCAVCVVVQAAVGYVVVEALEMVGGGRFEDIYVFWYAVGSMREG